MKANSRSQMTASGVAQASEVKYELQSLGWNAFQDLCATIMTEELGQTFEIFSPTKDGGRDGYFQGKWRNRAGASWGGSFSVQCKHTSRAGASLALSDVSEEIPKARRLAREGLADTYVLMTNYNLSGLVDEDLRRTFEEIGVKRFLGFGFEWICRRIRESARLRMLVPRIYGLGDLSEIIDTRWYDQALEILSSLSDDLSKFVITGAYTKSAKALQNYGFVLLLGEPGSGKSAIAQALALAAIDRWKCRALKIDDPSQVRGHWNVHEPRQFFWIDDAFGTTQYQRALSDIWNKTFSSVETAINKGARFVLTSRDYIYRAASPDLKESAFPLIKESQVIIDVEVLSSREKAQILYNHLKRGKQSMDFRSAVKPFLPALVSAPHFLPEVARRLSDPLFTRNIYPSQSQLLDFVENPAGYLLEVLENQTADNRAALALIFMRGGNLTSPIDLTPGDHRAVRLLGSSESAVVNSLSALEGSLVKLERSGGQAAWSYKHPTIRDALADLVVQQPELLDVYLEGTPLDRVLEEVTCGEVGLEGVKVIVPPTRYQRVFERLQAAPSDRGSRYTVGAPRTSWRNM
jgi:hypothetical protein